MGNENRRKWAPMDAETRFCEDKTITADGAIQEASADVILAIGPGFKEGIWATNVSALDQTTGDETVILILQATNDADFTTAANIVELGRLILGAAAPGGVDLLTGRYNIGFHNERNGTTYKNVRLYADVAGTSPSLTFDCWITIN
jgi:hypothetical protein